MGRPAEEPEEPISEDGLDVAQPRLFDRAPNEFSALPAGADRELVQQAVAMGAHVFLTRDAGILRHRGAMESHLLMLASPLDLLEELVACGAMLAVMRPDTVYWPLPDLQRTSHLIQALPRR